MPLKCSVPGCKSNYDSIGKTKYVTVFRFPENEKLRALWLQRIPRKDWSPGISARVCEFHFESKFVSTFEEFTDKDGNRKQFLRKRPLLMPNAVPTIFKELPKYLSSTSVTERSDPAKRMKLVAERHEKAVNDFMLKDIISHFDDFVKLFTNYLEKTSWKFEVHPDDVIVYLIDFTEMPKVTVSVKVDRHMNVTVFKNEFHVSVLDLKWLFNIQDGRVKLERWSQFQNLLSRYSANSVNTSSQNVSLNTLKEAIISHFENIIRLLEDAEDDTGEETKQKLTFLAEQFTLAFENKKARRYSSKMIVNAFLIYLQSPAAYQALKANCLLTLPHVNYLTQLTRKCEVSVDNQNHNEHFLKMKCRSLPEREKFITLQLDEIYVKKKIDYKCGKLYGYAENENEVTVAEPQAAKTILAFLIASSFGHLKEVAALRPVNLLTGNDLTLLTQEVSKLLISCGFKIVVIISDNNRINRTLFNNLSRGCETYRTRITEDCKTFLTFDSVHIIKTIRNNWLNQKDTEKTFLYPSFTNHEQKKQAKFSVLREIYKKESNQLLKTAPKLNFKTVFPTILERQKVSLAINVFDESTIAAVRLHTGNEEDGTLTFLEIIHQWWTIMNIKDKFLHIYKRNPVMKPFDTAVDERLVWLNNFLKWLEQWKPVHRNAGFLTTDTYGALYQQTSVMIDFIKYSLEDLKVEYILPGKIQTDALEKRFSRYRSLSGNNYNVSVVQVIKN